MWILLENSYTMVPLMHVEDLVVGSIQALDDSVYDFNKDEVEEFYCSETLL